MENHLSKQIWEKLICPFCGNPLDKFINGAQCSSCHQKYFYSKDDQLDLRLHKNKSYQLQFELEKNSLTIDDYEFSILKKNPAPEVDFSKIRVPWHLTKEMLSYFPKAKNHNSIVLDLGCGAAIHKKVCEHAGFEYVGLDFNSSNASILADAHAIPFKDNSVEFVLSIAVLEHIQYPFIMIKEINRVLKPGGFLIGTVAFLEPFHDNSYYHHTHLGILNLMKFAGFNIKHIAPNTEWSVLMAQAKMSLFPGLPFTISKIFVIPVYILHRMWWKLCYFINHSNNLNEKNRVFHTTGAFFFVVSKSEK